MKDGNTSITPFSQGFNYFPTCMSAVDRHHTTSDIRACMENFVENFLLQLEVLRMFVTAVNPNLTDITCLAEQPSE
ncbi:hypothetical protein AGR3A_Cc190036 [Agrobacterium tomkonis CFBP 6623]|uniref:Uncharacterized protein n=1 Tax=Agrobacterium tomkonis CFBP 6623 TaxID=1183432 RepID=A0A1S7P0A8_9HYPH|nr:hypothetical protein AGR3A_Cc190036 [Agrobacterium tomkonis CFBP 6623]